MKQSYHILPVLGQFPPRRRRRPLHIGWSKRTSTVAPVGVLAHGGAERGRVAAEALGARHARLGAPVAHPVRRRVERRRRAARLPRLEPLARELCQASVFSFGSSTTPSNSSSSKERKGRTAAHCRRVKPVVGRHEGSGCASTPIAVAAAATTAASASARSLIIFQQQHRTAAAAVAAARPLLFESGRGKSGRPHVPAARGGKASPVPFRPAPPRPVPTSSSFFRSRDPRSRARQACARCSGGTIRRASRTNLLVVRVASESESTSNAV